MSIFRHLLVGSPGGYSWTQEVETILSSEYKWKTKQGIHIDKKMLPIDKRKEIFEKEWDQIDSDDKQSAKRPKKITTDNNHNS